MIKALAFDLGNVLFGFDYAIALDKIEGKISVSKKELLDQIYENQFGLDFEKGLIEPVDFFTDFKKRFKASFNYDYFLELWSDIFYPNEDVIALTRRLNQRYPLYLISNINRLHFEYLYREFKDVFSIFDKLILSYEVKSIKPEKKIYQHLKDAAGVGFNEMAYIDDRRDLIEQAMILGLNCVQFKDCHQLISDLDSLGVAV
ncbi:MAG: HAD family phosphatase [Candidatus Omnitrophica bacterium]|nr:HAD family phosphatase [Candidatus Omnitrophota bacterium]